jgi:phenylpyruvate tautomerase PptA (4-oxalocrotonate tautomerase family)
MFSGRDEETKARLTREIAAVVAEVTVNSMSDVHVIVHEVDRDNWAKGAVLASRREKKPRPAPQRPEYASVSYITYESDTEDEYLKLRRDVINPGMATQEGFIDSLLLRRSDVPGQYLLVNRWLTADDARRYQSGPVHDGLREQALQILPKPLETFGTEVVHLDPEAE